MLADALVQPPDHKLYPYLFGFAGVTDKLPVYDGFLVIFRIVVVELTREHPLQVFAAGPGVELIPPPQRSRRPGRAGGPRRFQYIQIPYITSFFAACHVATDYCPIEESRQRRVHLYGSQNIHPGHLLKRHKC